MSSNNTVDTILQQLNNISLQNAQIMYKLSMPDSILRISKTLFYLPNYPIDVIQQYIGNYQKYFEQDTLDDIAPLIPDNPVMLDIGANIGNHSLYFAIERHAKKIYAFEPIAETFNILKKNIEINKLENVITPLNIALSDCNTNADIKAFNIRFMGAAQIDENIKGSIEVRTVDSLEIEENIDFIKIDVEGHELKVLEGAIKTIEKHRPVIFIELLNNEIEIVTNMLEEYGYVLYKGYPLTGEDNYLKNYTNCIYTIKIQE